MRTGEKMKCCWVIYTTGGEHLTIDGDKLRQDEQQIMIYRELENGDLEWIATFFRDKVVGWETIKANEN